MLIHDSLKVNLRYVENGKVLLKSTNMKYLKNMVLISINPGELINKLILITTNNVLLVFKKKPIPSIFSQHPDPRMTSIPTFMV